MISLNSCSYDELAEIVSSLGEKSYRIAQLHRWLYADKVSSFDDMTNLSKSFRNALASIATITQISELSRIVSKKDGSMKVLFELADGERVESVILLDADRITACVSTQVGCRMGCRFCTTATIGFKRNLKTAEILEQVRHLEHIVYTEGLHSEPRLTNIVFMGMGEPLDNYENVTKALNILLDEACYSYSHRRVTLSTVGLTPKIAELFADGHKMNLAVSVNAPNQDIRATIMPISTKYKLTELVQTLKTLPLDKRKRITIEYVMIGGVNDSVQHAMELVKLVDQLPVKINLIKYNGGGDPSLKPPQEKNILDFQQTLIDNDLTAFIRKSLGSDIFGACGQLAAGYNKQGIDDEK